MALRFVEDKTAHQGPTQMTLVIEGDKPEELTTPDARNEVLVEARRRGFPARGLNTIPSPYPVDAAGETDEDLIFGRRKVAAYRADYVVSAGIG